MDQALAWMSDWEAALARAKDEDKPVFLDFFNPN
jgi:uncharacterized protein YyaL (SSP411 family)